MIDLHLFIRTTGTVLLFFGITKQFDIDWNISALFMVIVGMGFLFN